MMPLTFTFDHLNAAIAAVITVVALVLMWSGRG